MKIKIRKRGLAGWYAWYPEHGYMYVGDPWRLTNTTTREAALAVAERHLELVHGVVLTGR